VSLALLSRYCFGEFNCLNHKRLRQGAAANINTKNKPYTLKGTTKKSKYKPKECIV